MGTLEAAARQFEGLRPYVRLLWGLQGAVGYFTADGSALDIAVDALRTAAFHFTRRPHFYGPRDPVEDAPNVADRSKAPAVLEGLRPCAVQLRALQGRCRPFGRDWQALNIPLQGLETSAFHFTGVPHFYGSRGDSAGPVRVGGGAGV